MSLGVTEENGVVFHLKDAGIGDSYFEDIRGEVFEACFRGTHGLEVDIPVDLPNFRRDLIEETGFFHDIAEFGREDFGEGSDGEIKIDLGGMPSAIEGGERAARDDVMDMRDGLNGAGPREVLDLILGTVFSNS